MKVRYDTYCGLNCGACPVGRANEMNDTEAIKGFAEEWGIAVEDLKCTGCKTEISAKLCTSCKMRQCAREKDLEFCYQCTDYLCEAITSFRNDKASNYSAVFSNLKKIEKNGLEEC